MRSLPAAALLSWSLLGCGGETLEAVGNPGGAFRSGAGCNVADLQSGGPQACPGSATERAQLRFDELTDQALVSVSANLTDKHVSCRRSWCGPGSLAFQAAYRWPITGPTEDEKLGEVRHRFDAPMDLFGKTVTHALFVEGVFTPINAFVAAIDGSGRFWMIQDGPVNLFGQWVQRGARVDVENARLGLPAGTAALLVSELRIAVYLATDVRAGDREHWQGRVHIDELGWR